MPYSYRTPTARTAYFERARVRAAFFAAWLRWLALRLRVAAAFFAAAWRFAGPPLARSSSSATADFRSAIALRLALPGGLPSTLLKASASELAVFLRRPLARRVSNRSRSTLAIVDAASLWLVDVDKPPQKSGEAIALLLALGLSLLDLALELLHHVGVAQRGDVTELAALRDVAQQAAHDLARAGLRQVVGPDDALGPRELADPLGDVLADLLHELVVALALRALERDEGGHGLAGVLALLAERRGLGDLRVGHDRRLDLGRRHAVPRDVEHVVDAPDDPEVAVFVLAGGVAHEVDVAAELVPVRLDEAV